MGSAASHRSASLLGMMVRRPNFLAVSLPAFISAYTAVLPTRAHWQNSVMENTPIMALGLSWGFMLGMDSLGSSTYIVPVAPVFQASGTAYAATSRRIGWTLLLPAFH